jgi:ATP-dependent protease HslVU (ClpYQ) peptidase subunit
MASDSIASDGDTRCTVRKLFKLHGGIIGVAGDMSQCVALVRYLKRAKRHMLPPDVSGVEALHLTRHGKILCYDGSLTPFEILDDFAAIGSGAGPALGAMHAGVDIATAIRIAAKVNSGTGGTVVFMAL